MTRACSFPSEICSRLLQVRSALKAESRANSVMATVVINPLHFTFKAGNPVTELTNCQGLSHSSPMPRGKKRPLFHLWNKPQGNWPPLDGSGMLVSFPPQINERITLCNQTYILHITA